MRAPARQSGRPRAAFARGALGTEGAKSSFFRRIVLKRRASVGAGYDVLVDILLQRGRDHACDSRFSELLAEVAKGGAPGQIRRSVRARQQQTTAHQRTLVHEQDVLL